MAVTKPTTLPAWATLDVVDPTSGKNNVVEPSLTIKNRGWDFKEKPPRQWWNWLGRITSAWITWLSQWFTGAVNIIDYGADPTGILSSDAALTAAFAAGNSIFVPAGTYLITASHAIPEGGTLWGVGLESKFDCQGTGMHFTFTGSGCIRDLSFLGDITETGQVAVQMGGNAEGKQNYLYNCFFNACAKAVSCIGTALVRENLISDCHIQYCTTGIYLVGCDNMIEHCTIKECDFAVRTYQFDHNVHAVIGECDIRDGEMYFETAKAITISNCILGIDIWRFITSVGIEIKDCIMIVGYANLFPDDAGQRASFYRFIGCRDYDGFNVTFTSDPREVLDAGYGKLLITAGKVVAAGANEVISGANGYTITASGGMANNPNQTLFSFADAATGRIYAKTGHRLITLEVRLFITTAIPVTDIAVLLANDSDFVVMVPLQRPVSGGAACWASGTFQIPLAVDGYIQLQIKNHNGAGALTVDADSLIRGYNL
jgi:hypothetical protein